jgi:hypothetical protein
MLFVEETAVCGKERKKNMNMFFKKVQGVV